MNNLIKTLNALREVKEDRGSSCRGRLIEGVALHPTSSAIWAYALAGHGVAVVAVWAIFALEDTIMFYPAVVIGLAAVGYELFLAESHNKKK